MALVQKKAEELQIGDWMQYPQGTSHIFQVVSVMETATEVVVGGSIFNGSRVDFDTMRYPLGKNVVVAE